MFNLIFKTMRCLKINFGDSNKIQSLIDNSYDSLGKIKEATTNIILNSDDINYKILSGMDHYDSVKILNDLIDGSILCHFIDNGDHIEIKPKSLYCIKQEKYTFY